MELSEAGRRIFGQHWPLILVCIFFVLVGIGFGALVRGGSQTYTASTRLILDTQDPKARSESASIADTAKAIATSPSQVRAALNDAHVTKRDPLDVAKHHVSVRALGTSAVLQLSVSDRNPRVAAAVSNALAARVIRVRLDVSNGRLQQKVLTDLEQRIDEFNTKIASVDAQIDSLNVRLANAGTAAGANARRARRDAATRSRDFLAQQRGVLESERVSLLSTNALRPKPSIISPATVPEHADASRWLSYLVLGTFLGLILGVAQAGLIEVIRPTLVGSDVLARELDTPLLGTLPNEPDADISEALPPVTARLWLAAGAAGVETVGLFPAAPGLDLSGFAERLEAIPPGALDPQHSAVAMDHARPGLRIRPFSLHDSSADVQGGVGLVLVAPTEMKKAELIDVGQLLRLTPVPLLGLVTYTPQSSRRRGRAWKQALETRTAGQPQASPPRA